MQRAAGEIAARRIGGYLHSPSSRPAETVRDTGISEVRYSSLPVLSEFRFGLFRSPTASTKARALMETALATSIQAATGNRLAHSARAQGLPSDENSLPAFSGSLSWVVHRFKL